jgi:hypothetical protein
MWQMHMLHPNQEPTRQIFGKYTCCTTVESWEDAYLADAHMLYPSRKLKAEHGECKSKLTLHKGPAEWPGKRQQNIRKNATTLPHETTRCIHNERPVKAYNPCTWQQPTQ